MNKKIKSRFAEGVLSIPTQAYQLWVGNFARSVKFSLIQTRCVMHEPQALNTFHLQQLKF